MTRPALLLGVTALILSLGGGGAWWLTRRTPGTPPQEEVLRPFRVSAVGAGQCIELQPPSTPLRSLRWTSPLPGGAVVAQILTQTGRQQAALFLQGDSGPTFTLPDPADAPGTFFHFADLADAALAPGDALVLLYRNAGETTAPALVLAWDLRTRQVRWSHRASGERLALSPDRRSVLLFGASTPVHILDLVARPTGAAPRLTTVDLPSSVGAVSNLIPIGPRSFLMAHASGLSSFRDGAWVHVQAPPASPLGFARGLGTLTGGPRRGWWQPEPGTLIPLGAQGTPEEPRNLNELLPDADYLDACLLRLLGEDPDGRLWFGLARPTLPAPGPAVPAAEPAETGSPEAAGVPVLGRSREIWEAHIRHGLDRLYCWKPGEDRMTSITLGKIWARLAPPPGLGCPGSGEEGLRPEAGAMLCGGPERVWWLPLGALQPR